MTAFRLCAALLVSAGVLPDGRAAEPTSASRPNIVIMMADDMGWSDIGCYGGEIRTPNLDGLAANGVRFTQFYNTSRCCPTRASLLTGLYPHQAGVGHMMEDKGYDNYRGNLSPRAVTIAEVLRGAGYATYMSGKWHVSRHVAPEGPKHNWPLQRGFDRFFGTIHGAGSFYDPNSLTLGNTQIPPGADFYYTDAISDFAARCIHEHEAEKPFFLYVAFTAPHWPMHAKPGDIAKYQGVYDAGWDAIRQARYDRLVRLGLIRPDWPLSPRDPRSPAWAAEERQEWNIRCMEVFAAMVDCLDQGVGRILEALRATARFDNTLVLFLADNGGCAEGYGRNAPFQARPTDPAQLKPMPPDELQPRMQPEYTRDGLPVRVGAGVMPGPADTYIAYGLSWANASNTPFREYKHWVHEGGISAPLIMHWPAAIEPARRNALYEQPAHLIDLMATCVDLAGAEYPARFRGEAIQPMEGVSLRPALAGAALERPQPIFWEHEGNRAVREGEWKLVAKHNQPWELYNLRADRTELNNLAAAHPDRVQAMSAQYDAWAERAGVQPWPVKPVAITETRGRRPNILFAIADDWGWPHAGAYGDSVVRTPTFDRLSQNGVLFANAFVTSPSCTPSRGSILTGQWHWRLEENASLWSTLRPEYPTYPEMLEDAGYFIGHSRKAWGPGRIQAAGRKGDPSGPAFPNFAAFLEKRGEDQPFCYWFGANDPHRPYEWQSGRKAGIDPARVQVPKFLPDAEVIRDDVADYYFEVERFDRELGEALALLEARGELDNTLVVVTGDNGMPFPRAKSNLYDAGTHVPLVFSWPAQVKGGRAVTDFVSLSDLAPTFLRAAGLDVPEVMTGRNLLPILRRAGNGRMDPTRDHVLTGKERHVPAQEAGNMSGYPCRAIRTQDFLYIRNFKPERWPAGVRTNSERGPGFADCDGSPSKTHLLDHEADPVVKPFFDLAFARRPAEELFDLRTDPDQLVNVAGQPDYAEIQRDLAERLLSELQATGDPRAFGKGDHFRDYPYYGGTARPRPAAP
ncbi:MAG: sulfatase-like hydrolase/transferase [Verrucomicrobiales bacterium]|nr:sulfatase-like hydrolase/transferase [Verrucomicrobiales bacterium]